MSPLSYLLEYNRIYNILGIVVILAIAATMSHNRSGIRWRLVLTALCLHISIAFLVLKTSVGRTVIASIAGVFTLLYQAADSGIEFVFGNLSHIDGPWGFIFAVKILPVIVFFGAFMGMLFYLRIIQTIVMGINYVIQPLLGTTGPETLCAVANSFLGQTEAPLLIKHYLKDMTKSEFLVMMISGMGTISGSILAVFAVMGVPAEHLLAASVMAIPATILIAKIIYPETEESTAMVNANAHYDMHSGNIFDAISQGTSDGLWLALNVGAMLISFLALLGMLNGLLYFICIQSNYLFSTSFPVITLGKIFAWVCLPFAWLLGFGGTEATQVGQLIGTKVAVNELVAYSEMLKMGLSPRTISVVTYALCGFSNFSCIGMQIGGIGSLVPEKRKWISSFGITAVFGGALANLLSAMVASLLL
ncbi:NupC/NupG family nucleoside CNT transporter [Candidatus Dependentiae bacterium]|nr:NupC/NupG family nucleoside CNT transporter [Candidatus Dependentiae bacterium]